MRSTLPGRACRSATVTPGSPTAPAVSLSTTTSRPCAVSHWTSPRVTSRASARSRRATTPTRRIRPLPPGASLTGRVLPASERLSAGMAPASAASKVACASGGRGPRSRARWRKTSRFPFGPWSTDAATPPMRSPISTAARGDAADGVAARLPRPDHTALAHLGGADLELGLHEGDDLGRVGQTRGHGGQHLAERDEGHVDRGEARTIGEPGGIEVPRVHTLPDHHAAVVSEAGMELAVPHVDRVDAESAPAQQAVGEPAGGRADVEAHASPDVHVEGLERRDQLLAAPPDEGRRRDLLHGGVEAPRGGRLSRARRPAAAPARRESDARPRRGSTRAPAPRGARRGESGPAERSRRGSCEEVAERGVAQRVERPGSPPPRRRAAPRARCRTPARGPRRRRPSEA